MQIKIKRRENLTAIKMIKTKRLALNVSEAAEILKEKTWTFTHSFTPSDYYCTSE